MTSANCGKGTRLIIDNVIVGEIYGIGDITLDRDTLDVTNSDSLSCSREFIPGLKTGTFSVTGNFISSDAGQQDIEDAYTAGTKDLYEIAFPNDLDQSYEFNANVSDFSVTPPHDGVISFDASFQVTEPGTYNTTGSTGLTTPFFTISGDISGALTPSPTPSGSIYEYTVTPGITDTYVTVTPTAATGTIYVNGSVVATGVASDPISVGSFSQPKNIFIEVKDAGKAPKIYLIGVTPVHNLLNIGFELWSDGPSGDPDGWVSKDTLTVSRSSDSYLGTYAVQGVGTGANAQYIYFDLDALDIKDGQNVTFSAWVKSSDADVGVFIRDANISAKTHTGSGNYELLSVSVVWETGDVYNECRLYMSDASTSTFIADSAKLTIS